MENSMRKFVAENWFPIALFALNVGGGIFYTGVTVARQDARIDRAQESIAEIQKSGPTETRWRVDNMRVDLNDIKGKRENDAVEVAKLTAKIDLLNQKMDYLVERQKEREAKP